MRRDRKYAVEDPSHCNNVGEEEDGAEDDGDEDGYTIAGDVIGEGVGVDEDEMEKYAAPPRRFTPSPPPAPRQGRCSDVRSRGFLRQFDEHMYERLRRQFQLWLSGSNITSRLWTICIHLIVSLRGGL